jgi:hypothetical protein
MMGLVTLIDISGDDDLFLIIASPPALLQLSDRDPPRASEGERATYFSFHRHFGNWMWGGGLSVSCRMMWLRLRDLMT